jgi:hypothetical protein
MLQAYIHKGYLVSASTKGEDLELTTQLESSDKLDF